MRLALAFFPEVCTENRKSQDALTLTLSQRERGQVYA